MTSHALRTIRPHRTRYRRKVEAMRQTVATPAVRGAERWAAQLISVNARDELRDRPESTATVTSGGVDGHALDLGNAGSRARLVSAEREPQTPVYAAGIESGPLTPDLDPMQSSDERHFWSHPAPDRREYDVHYVMRRRPRLVTMGEMVGASLFISFVIFIATAIVAWLVWQVLA